MSDQSVRFETEGDIAFIVIANPPVNAASIAVRVGLREAVARLAADSSLTAGVIIGDGRTFIAGADIKEFGKPPLAPELPAVIGEIERCPKPLVAAIHGAALGGGFELALACDARIAAPDAVVGLPEVQLGMIPGAGGTQRLPRLVGIAKAIDLVVSGKRLRAPEALALGIIDQIAHSGSLREAAATFARRSRKRVLGTLHVPADSPGDITMAEDAARKIGRGREAVREAVEAVKRAGSMPFDAALQEERTVFQRLRNGEEAAALRYNFFAERQAGRLVDQTHPREVKTVGIVGAGTMGAGIAAVFAAGGFDVVLTDAKADILERAKSRIAETLGDLVRGGKIEAHAADEALARIGYFHDLTAVATADLVIEAVFEELRVKSEVLQRLGAIVRKDAVIASNTSYLDLDLLAEATARPSDVVGLHFFAPVHRMRLVEVVRGARTAPDVLATGIAAAKAIGKLPIIAGVCEGFIGNRIYAKYRAQCEFMLQEGALPHEIDRAIERLGFAMGPFAVSDLSGLDIAWLTRKRRAVDRDPRERYVAIADRLCEMGRLGRKTGAGWYDYSQTASGRGKADPIVNAIVKEEAEKHGPSRTFTDSEIQQRALGAIVNEAALIVEEGIARSAADVDLVMVNGYGFSKFRGGPLFVASRMDDAEVTSMIDAVEQAAGFGFKRGDSIGLLDTIRG
jgi:3-hydroxyacyl-CoA dehydrogenase